MKMHYDALAGRTDIGFATENDAGTELTARTTTGVTETRAGRYTVDVAGGTTVVWFEGTVYATSERAPDGVAGKTLSYRVLLDSNGDGVADVPNVGIAGVTCILTSDSSGAVQIGSAKVSDAQGYVTFRGLVAGTYYVWRDHPRYRFANPIAIVVT